jgi:hypothetical protein
MSRSLISAYLEQPHGQGKVRQAVCHSVVAAACPFIEVLPTRNDVSPSYIPVSKRFAMMRLRTRVERNFMPFPPLIVFASPGVLQFGPRRCCTSYTVVTVTHTHTFSAPLQASLQCTPRVPAFTATQTSFRAEHFFGNSRHLSRFGVKCPGSRHRKDANASLTTVVGIRVCTFSRKSEIGQDLRSRYPSLYYYHSCVSLVLFETLTRDSKSWPLGWRWKHLARTVAQSYIQPIPFSDLSAVHLTIALSFAAWFPKAMHFRI